jgi:Uma2 family endonuclease
MMTVSDVGMRNLGHAHGTSLPEEDGSMSMPSQVHRWTIEQLHSLPDDGNKYELIRGQLLVTPAPTVGHETILARLTRLLDPYVEAHDLGLVYRPKAVIRIGTDSEVEPDLMVRQPPDDPDASSVAAMFGPLRA